MKTFAQYFNSPKAGMMKTFKTIPSLKFATSILLLQASMLLLGTASAQGNTIPVSTNDWSAGELDIWNDPVFKKEFVAGYGINSEVEPRISQEELLVLEQVRPMLSANSSEAIPVLQKTIALKPDSSAILDFTLGGVYFQQDKMAEARENYLKAVQKFPNFRRAHRNLGLIYTREANYDEAIKSFTKMIELGGGDAFSYGLLGFAYSAKQDFQAAEAAYRNALLLQPANTEWRIGITRCVFKQRKYEEAVTMLELLIEQYPTNHDFWLLQAQAYLAMKQSLKAAQNLEAIRSFGKGTAESMNTLGDIYFQENLFDLAARSYKFAIDADADQSLDRPIRSAEMLAGRGDNANSKSLLQHIRDQRGDKLSDDDRRKILKIQARLNMAEGDTGEETAKILEEIITVDPLDGEALLLLGQHYARLDQPDKAILYFERAESIEAHEVNAKVRHAQVLVSMGRYSDAVPLLRRAQELKPREDVARYLEQIERISKTR